MRLIHVCCWILCSFNGKVFKHREEKEKAACFHLFVFLLAPFVSSQSCLKHYWRITGLFAKGSILRTRPLWGPTASFFWSFSVATWPSRHRPSVPMFPSANSRGWTTSKLFDQVSRRETLCINWHIGTTTEAPSVDNYWTFKLLPQLSPRKYTPR